MHFKLNTPVLPAMHGEDQHEVPHHRHRSATRREVSVPALGAMLFGSRTDEKTSFAVLDRYAEAGGTSVATSDNYALILYVLHTWIQWEHLPRDCASVRA